MSTIWLFHRVATTASFSRSRRSISSTCSSSSSSSSRFRRYYCSGQQQQRQQHQRAAAIAAKSAAAARWTTRKTKTRTIAFCTTTTTTTTTASTTTATRHLSSVCTTVLGNHPITAAAAATCATTASKNAVEEDYSVRISPPRFGASFFSSSSLLNGQYHLLQQHQHLHQHLHHHHHHPIHVQWFSSSAFSVSLSDDYNNDGYDTNYTDESSSSSRRQRQRKRRRRERRNKKKQSELQQQQQHQEQHHEEERQILMSKKKDKHQNQHHQQQHQHGNQTNKKKTRKRRRGKAAANAVHVHQTHAPNGRRIMTQERLHIPDVAALQIQDHNNPAKHLLKNLQHSMLFTKHHTHHYAAGPPRDQLFYATTTIAVAPDILPRVPREGQYAKRIQVQTEEDNGYETTTTSTSTPPVLIQLEGMGAARSKKQAERLAAVDVLLQFHHDCGIDIHNPPNALALRKAAQEQALKEAVSQAKMRLELYGFSTSSSPSSFGGLKNNAFMIHEQYGHKYVADVTLWSRHHGRRRHGHHSSVWSHYHHPPNTDGGSGHTTTPYLFATGEPAPNKALAQGHALVAAAGEPLQAAVNPDKMQLYEELLQTSPGQQMVALHVPRLPEETFGVLDETVGYHRPERIKEYETAKTVYWQKYNRHRQRQELLDNNKQSSSDSRSRSINNDKAMYALNEMFRQEEQARLDKAMNNPDSKQGKIKAVRDALPIVELRDQLLEALRTDQVVVVSGGTGSGKSTQCAQYILEDAIANNRGADTRIVVTQPRRIAAISVAERVADERDESVGNSVGYTVRFRQQPPRSIGASIEFVTTGVLLRRIVNHPELEDVSHVICDEVHERDIDSDFLLVLLRDLLAQRPDLKVILMSATLDADSFASYFSRQGKVKVPSMGVPAKPRHPVEVIHLEDLAGESPSASSLFGEASPPSVRLPLDLQDVAKSLLQYHDQQLMLELEDADAEEEAASRLEGEKSISSDDSSESDSSSDDEEEGPMSRAETLRSAVSTRNAAVGGTITAASRRNQRMDKREIGEITVALIAKLVQYAVRVETDQGRRGSLLCFLPGWDEIRDAMRALEEADPLLQERMVVLPLHSTIPQDDQQRVFIPAEEGTVKVILATNIAESSVTIDDVLAVIDSGLVREMTFDAESVMSTMETVPTSRASATQRLGRAGRVAPGKCYRLYSRGALEAMYERPTPEIQRTALEDTCLQTCSMTNKGVATFLQRAMDPPTEESVALAMERLVSLGAIDADATTGEETLSPLGRCLSRLPLDPATGRMLIMGCVMQCLDPVLTAAACFSSRDLFHTPPGMREEQREVRQSFCDMSDLRANVRAYNEFQQLIDEEGWDSAKEWAKDNFISIAAMSTIRNVRSQLLNELSRIGLIHRSDVIKTRGNVRLLRKDASVNDNAGMESLHVALWATGLPGNLAARRQLGNFGTFRTRVERHAGLHPSSVAFHRKPPPREQRIQLPSWFLYREMILSSQVFLRGCTAIEPVDIVLFGGYSLQRKFLPPKLGGGGDGDGGESLVTPVLDNWIVVESGCRHTLDLLTTLREEIDAALNFKVMFPKRPLPESSQSIMDSICKAYDTEEDDDDDEDEEEEDHEGYSTNI